MLTAPALLAVSVLFSVTVCLADGRAGARSGNAREAAGKGPGNHYEDHAHVVLYVNKLGPASNPNEVYKYYDYPFCRPSKIQEKRLTLGEVLGILTFFFFFSFSFKFIFTNIKNTFFIHRV
jgi:hypothetical protein